MAKHWLRNVCVCGIITKYHAKKEKKGKMGNEGMGKCTMTYSFKGGCESALGHADRLHVSSGSSTADAEISLSFLSGSM